MFEINSLELPSPAICTALCEIIETNLKSKNYNIAVSSASKPGEDNFVGIVYRVLYFQAEQPENVNKVIIKVAPQNLARRKQFFSRECFLQEIYMYNEVLSQFKNFELSKGMNGEAGFHEYPQCYGNVSEAPTECLLLEDLCVRNFNIVDRFTRNLTADHVRLVLLTLSKFHAISFAMKDQKPEKFNQLASELKETFFRKDNKGLRELFDKQAETILNVVSDEKDADLLAKIKKLFKRPVIEHLFDCIDNKLDAVITHGDAWQNNILFRYDENGKPIEISLVDWQIARYTSPILDIVYFIFTCTTKHLRDAHYQDFLNIYHKSLSAHIRSLGSDPGKLFPLSLMHEHLRKFSKFGLLLSCLVLPVMTMDRGTEVDLDEYCENIEKQKKAADGFLSEKSRKKFNQRLRDVVCDMARLEYI